MPTEFCSYPLESYQPAKERIHSRTPRSGFDLKCSLYSIVILRPTADQMDQIPAKPYTPHHHPFHSNLLQTIKPSIELSNGDERSTGEWKGVACASKFHCSGL